MKITSLAIFAILLLSVSTQFTPNPVPVENYYSANALLDYLMTHTLYYRSDAPNSLFFQFDWYISQQEVAGILQKMDDIYQKYQFNGVFLILNQAAGITDLDTYSREMIKGLEQRWNLFSRENVYLIIVQYVPGAWGAEWKLNFAISCGDNVNYYLPDSNRKKIMDTYADALKYYTQSNVLRLINDIEYVIDQNYSSGGSVSIGVIIVVVCIVLCCGGGGAYYGKKRYDTRSGGDGIHVTSAQY